MRCRAHILFTLLSFFVVYVASMLCKPTLSISICSVCVHVVLQAAYCFLA